MIGVIFLVFFVAAILMVMGIVLLFRGRQIDIHIAIRKRFQHLTLDNILLEQPRGPDNAFVEWWTQKLLRAGLEPSKPNSLMMSGALAGALLIGLLGWGAQGLLLPVILLVLVHLYLEYRSRLRSALMLSQLPGFVDHVIRGLGTGRTMENTVLLAAQQCQSPLFDVLDRVRVHVELGARMGDELQQAAKVHRLRELQLMALAVVVNERFGGSARELLQSIVTMIQQRDQAQRELRALTGETRLSAWVLGLLPLGVAVYMMAMNPNYLDVMWQDDSGRMVLLTAVVMQALGALLLWRLVRSI